MVLLLVLLFTAGVWACALSLASTSAISLSRALVARMRRALRRQQEVLPADWWERFEADFREYTSRGWRTARRAERQL